VFNAIKDRIHFFLDKLIANKYRIKEKKFHITKLIIGLINDSKCTSKALK
jgi:hypothetical protein